MFPSNDIHARSLLLRFPKAWVLCCAHWRFILPVNKAGMIVLVLAAAAALLLYLALFSDSGPGREWSPLRGEALSGAIAGHTFFGLGPVQRDKPEYLGMRPGHVVFFSRHGRLQTVSGDKSHDLGSWRLENGRLCYETTPSVLPEDQSGCWTGNPSSARRR